MSNKLDYLQTEAEKIRVHSIKMTDRAGSGHPTSSMSEAEILSVLFFDQMHYDPNDDEARDADELIISKGHGVPGLYGAFEEAHMLDGLDIMTLREADSPIEGHPVPRVPGIKVATGSLGQGLSVGIGMAKAMKMDGIDRNVYVLLGDGEMAEGNVWEAMNIAPHLGLNNLYAIVDVNRLGQSDPTMYGWDTEAYRVRAEAFGWNAVVLDGHDVEELVDAFDKAQSSDRPTMIVAKTVKGKGASFAENKNGLHGKPLEDCEQALHEIEPRIHEVDYENDNTFQANGDELRAARHKKYRAVDIETDYEKGKMVATRDAYGAALVKLGKRDPDMVVLDGDVKNSTRTREFFKTFPDRAIECYIAEQNMIGMALGLQAKGKHAYVATFAAFLTRAHDQLRMAAYSRAVLSVAGSHTGVSIGQDGPSQMGLEDLSMMRSIFGSVIVSPADAVSAEKLLGQVAGHDGISYVRTIRGKTPVLYDNAESFHIGGSKVLRRSDDDIGVIVATGVTVAEAMDAAHALEEQGTHVAVVDCYSIKPVDADTLRSVSRDAKFVLTVEDHYPEGGMGEAVASALEQAVPVYVAGVTKMPHSGAPEKLRAEQRLDANGIVERVQEILS